MNTAPQQHSACHARVILVEDNDELRDDLLFQLQHMGFKVKGVPDATALDALLATEPGDIFVLDVNLPGEDGYSIARRLVDRQRRGIIMLTASDGIDDKLRGFEQGADLYLVKPVDRRELAAYIKALSARITPPPPSGSSWTLQQDKRLLIGPDGRTLTLTPQDLAAWQPLLEQPASTVGRDALIAALNIRFLDFPEGRINTVMSRLRQKLAAFDGDLRIVTWRNHGYSYVGPGIVRQGTAP
jgi:DNA-binding response OmpR family regulator